MERLFKSFLTKLEEMQRTPHRGADNLLSLGGEHFIEILPLKKANTETILH